MSTGQEHFRAAEIYLGRAAALSGEDYEAGEDLSACPSSEDLMRAALVVTMAQAHATLAATAATADLLQDPDGEHAAYQRRAWRLVTELDVEESGEILAAEGAKRLAEETRPEGPRL